MAASSSSPLTTAAPATDNLLEQKYDVFLSFRGVDTRAIFTSHLYAALDRRKIPTYMDDKSLESGGDIGPALLKAIEQSRLSIIILSKEYASSAWCLNELVQILECKKTCGQVVIPVFYDTDPAHVRRQTGTYGEAFAKHEERYDTDTVSMWRNALTTAANLSGFDSQNFRDQADLIEQITEVILLKLDLKGLVGAEKRIEKVESLLSIHTQDVPIRSVGIWGTGGIGKTTLAEAIYHRHCHKFEACSFLANITERSEKYGLEHLKNKLLCDLLNEDYSTNSSIKGASIDSTLDRKLSHTKVLIVLDDVSVLEQSKVLLLGQVQFGPGSRIIITSRTREALLGLVDHTYEVEELDISESHLLFRSIAFEDHYKSITSDYSDWSNMVVDYCQGIPLALRVLGSLFRDCNTKQSWERELKNLKNMSSKEIKHVLRLRYDRLEENDKGIFLDIACILKGMNKCEAERVLKMHGFDPRGIGNLSSAYLISISKDNHLKIHDLVEELGKDIALEGGPVMWFRVWDYKRLAVLEHDSGPLAVQALFLDISKISKQKLIGDTLFKLMPNLRSLKFYVPRESFEAFGEKKETSLTLNYSSLKKELPGVKALKDQCNTMYKCHIAGLDSLPEPLTYLYWDGYPFKYLPTKYSPHNLVELHLPHSRLENLLCPKGPLDFKVINLAYPKKAPKKPLNLKVINLRYSKNLIEVPDLTWCPSVERLDLSGCSSLLNLNYSGGNKIPILLKELLLCWCINLVSIPHTIYAFSLETLDLRGCRKLEELPRTSGGQYFSSLRRLNLSWCDRLKIPDGLILLPSLEEICLSGTMIESIPASIKKSSKLRKLVVKNCHKLQCLPELPPLLEILEADGCTSLKTVETSSSKALLQDGFPDCTSRERLMSTKSLDQIRKNELLEDGDRERLMFTKSLDQSLKNDLLEYVEHVYAKETGAMSFSVSFSDELQLQTKAPTRGPRFESDHGSPKNAPWLGERRIFSNCFKLEESARSNIIWDAQLRIQRIASSEREYGTVFAICPGDKIPPWFSYPGEGTSINIKFPQTDDKFLGFPLSVVFATQNEGCDFLYQLICDCKLKIDDREDYGFKFESPLVMSMKNSTCSCGHEDDNLLVFFQKDMFRRSPDLPLDKVIGASFSFSLRCYYGDDNDHEKLQVRNLRVKKCGIKILYA